MVITSPFLIPLTTCVYWKPGRIDHTPSWEGWSWTHISEPGVWCIPWRFTAVNVSHIYSLSLLHLFFLLPARAGQVFSHRHKTTSKRCHLLLEFARLAALFASRHSSNSNQYGHWKPIPAWTISAAPVSYVWGLNNTHSFYQDILESFLHNTHRKCVCAQ